MNPLTETQIRSSFVNATRREVAQATLPDLGEVAWDRLDYLGWRDRKAPLSAYVVLELEGKPTGVLLRSTEQSGRKRRNAVCAWCEDVVETDDVSLYVARRAGALGRRGNTVGTLVCTWFNCSRNVRRKPTRTEAGMATEAEKEQMISRRIEGLRERSTAFITEILSVG